MAPPTPSTAFLTAFAALLLLFAIADARSKELIATTSNQFPNSDPILLPSEKPAKEEKASAEQELPMTMVVRFRPINRNFAIRPTSYRFRHGATHRCPHSQVIRGLRPWTPRYGRIRHLPFTKNDEDVLTITTSDEAWTTNQLPLRWRQPDYKYKRPAVIDLSGDVIFPGDEAVKKPHHHQDGDGEHQHENLILNRIRKFLNHF